MMLVLLVPAVLTGALAGPSFLAVSRVCGARSFAPLVRGSLERTCVLAAAGIAAAAACAQVVLLAGTQFPIDELDSDEQDGAALPPLYDVSYFVGQPRHPTGIVGLQSEGNG